MMHLKSLYKPKPRALRSILFAVVLGWASVVAAESPPEFMQQLYPPDLVMKNHREIELSRQQRDTITKAIQSTQSTAVELRWTMQDAATELTRQMSAARIDREAALKAAERMMGVEGQVKRAHLGLLITIKNALTDEQQRKLDLIRAKGG